MQAFKATEIQPLVELAFRFGPFFFAVLCLLAAFVMWRKVGGKYIPLLFVSVGGLCVAVSIYYWVNPPRAVFVYQITAFHDEQPGKTELNENTLLVTSKENDGVWTKVLPSISGGMGFRTFTYEAVAIKNEPFTVGDDFTVDLVWYPRPADPSIAARPQRDRLHLPYLGGPGGTYVLLRVDDSTSDQGVFYEIRPTAAARHTTGASGFGLIRAAFAQSAEDLQNLSKDQLIELFEKTRGLAAAPAASMGFTQEPVIVYYKKSSDSVDIERALRARGSEPQVQASKLGNDPTNALWFGVDVPIDKAQKVAETLIEQGVELKYFGPFLRAGAKANRIEIGTDTSLVGDDVMTLEAIRQKAAELARARRSG